MTFTECGSRLDVRAAGLATPLVDRAQEILFLLGPKDLIMIDITAADLVCSNCNTITSLVGGISTAGLVVDWASIEN